MLIKYLKNAPSAYAGDVKDIPESHAKVLILTGYAKEYKQKTPKPEQPTDLLTPATATDIE